MAFDEKIDIGRVLQRGFGTIGRHAPGYLLLAMLLAGLPDFAAQYFTAAGLGAAVSPPSPGRLVSPLSGALALLAWLSAYLLQAALVRSSILDLSGRPADLGGSLIAALMLVLPMIGLTIVWTLAVAFAFLFLIVPGIILYVMWIVAVPVLVEERRGVFASLARSAELTRGSRWRIFGLLLLFIVFLAMVWTAFATLNAEPYENPLLHAAISAVGTTVTGLVGAAMSASLYVELKTVREGATTDSLAAIFA